MVYRCILPDWASGKGLPKVVEGEFNDERLRELNAQGYNIYFLPNGPSVYDPSTTVAGHHVDTFNYAFVDMDLKEGIWKSKQEFINTLLDLIIPVSLIVDSGNGVHAYWAVSDLDAMSFLKLQRRLCRWLKTDQEVSKIYQLMRAPGFDNTKIEGVRKPCTAIHTSDASYTAEHLDKVLPPLSKEDEAYCVAHYNRTYKKETNDVEIDDKLPFKFSTLIRDSKEAKEIWSGNTEDRSIADYRLGHIMLANGFTKKEAMSVLVNSAKAMARAPAHRVNYAQNIVEKIWAFETGQTSVSLSRSVRDILTRPIDDNQGKRFPCYRYLDATEYGFRLGQVIGLVAGSGVGKTAVALNMFLGFVQNNPDYDHFFVPLEQPAHEIAERWKALCGDQDHLYDKVQVISNYDDKGQFRHLSLDEIKAYILSYQESTGRKVGCVVIDHIGALKKKTKDGENQGLMEICHTMKAFAHQTNTMLVMQSQAPREKAGIGDLEINKDAAYGTVFFESYCDYLITMWQPLKRCYSEEGCPTVTAFKFCKIRHKKQGVDEMQEDVRYLLFFDPSTGKLRTITEQEKKSFDFFNNKSTNKRNQDRKSDVLEYTSIPWRTNGEDNSNHTPESNSQPNGLSGGQGIRRI